jgi:hypothetical protein
MVALMLPELSSLARVPITVGLVNEPAASESWAVKVLDVKVAVLDHDTVTGAPVELVMQNGDPLTAPV